MADLGVAIVRQYERGVVFRLGKVHNVREPGLRFMIPLVDRMRKVSMRTITMPIQSQQIITRDNVSIGVAAVAYFRRVDAVKSIVEIENVQVAVAQIAQTTVRNVVGRSQRAMARQAEAEREKRAKIIAAEGEALSAGRLAEAADVITDHPVALQLRNLQILGEIAVEKKSTIIFPAQFPDSVQAVPQFIEQEARKAGVERPFERSHDIEATRRSAATVR